MTEYEEGHFQNGWVLIGGAWISARPALANQTQYDVGDIANNHVWTGSDWIPIRKPEGSTMSAKDARRAALAAQKAKANEEHGRMVTSGMIGMTNVQIYERGYVKIGLLGTPERLVAISASDMTSQKTGVGRAAAGVVTLGLSMYSTSKRGSLYLTIVTESRTKTITTQTPTKSDITALHRLATAGQAVLDAQQRDAKGAETLAPGGDLATQVSRLAELRAAGALSEDEFAAAKKKLLSEQT